MNPANQQQQDALSNLEIEMMTDLYNRCIAIEGVWEFHLVCTLPNFSCIIANGVL